MDRQHMTIRANQLARQSGGRITQKDIAVKLAAEFGHASEDALLEFCFRIAGSIQEPDLPDEDNGQLELDLPKPLTGFLRLPTVDGLEFIEADVATDAEALSAMTAKDERHSKQARRAKKKIKEIRVVMGWSGYDRKQSYNDNCRRYCKALGADE